MYVPSEYWLASLYSRTFLFLPENLEAVRFTLIERRNTLFPSLPDQVRTCTPWRPCADSMPGSKDPSAGSDCYVDVNVAFYCV